MRGGVSDEEVSRERQQSQKKSTENSFLKSQVDTEPQPTAAELQPKDPISFGSSEPRPLESPTRQERLVNSGSISPELSLEPKEEANLSGSPEQTINKDRADEVAWHRQLLAQTEEETRRAKERREEAEGLALEYEEIEGQIAKLHDDLAALDAIMAEHAKMHKSASENVRKTQAEIDILKERKGALEKKIQQRAGADPMYQRAA